MTASTNLRTAVVRLAKGFKTMSLELAALLFMTSVLMTYLLMQDVLIERVCRVELGHSAEICQEVIQNTGNHTEIETEVQKNMAQLRRVRSLFDFSIPIVFVIFQGSFSDIHGRKLALLLPCLGFTLQALALFMSLYFKHWDGYTVALIATIPKCLSGSDVTFRMAALSHISDISENESRTARTGLISAAFTLGVPVGFAVGGWILKASISFEIAFLISAGLCVASILLIALFVDNKPKRVAVEDGKTLENIERRKRTCLSMENVKSVLRSLVLSFDGITRSTRFQIVVLIIALICVNAPIQGEFGIMYLYLRKKLGWNSASYGLFSTYVSLIGVVGTVLSMGILCSLLKLSDPVIGFVAGISQFAGCFMYAFAYNNTMIYLAPTIDMLNGTMAVIARAMLSKLTPPEDYGKMFSFLALLELLVPLGFDPTYTTTYEHTVETFPGAVFLLSAVMTVPPQLIYLVYIIRNRNAGSCEITDNLSSSTTTPAREAGTERSKYLSDAFLINNPVMLKSATSTTTVDTVI